MHRHVFCSRAAIFAAVATAGIVTLLPARAQTPGSIAIPTALTSSPTRPPPPARTPPPRAPPPPAGGGGLEHVFFDRRRPRRPGPLTGGGPIKMVALVSSSPFGPGASPSPPSYPSRLADELARHFPGHEIM